MTRWLGIAVFLITALIRPAAAEEIAGMVEAATRVRGEFTRLDRNNDLQLDLDEFQKMLGDRVVQRRDFLLFDSDSNGRLSRSEFACLPGLVEPQLRGSLPDPIDDLINDAVAALDESYDRWDQRPEEMVSAHTFVSNFLESISPEKKRFVTGRIIDQADRDTDGKISRSEAKHFLEQQLGLRLESGPPLREPTGRVVRYDRFLLMDRDHDGVIARQEFADGWWKASSADEAFTLTDTDHNGRVTYDEYSDPSSMAIFDPVEWFRQSDADLNAKLSDEELQASVDPGRVHLAISAMQSFDDDRDGELSLREYRSSMLGSYNYPWDHRPLDQDRDGSLSYDEFVFNEVDLFQLQRWFFFHRLDLDRSGGLTLDEFAFRPLEPLSIRAYSTRGDESKIVYQNRDYPDCGWPSVSPDGTQVLLHECPPNGPSEGRIVVVSLDEHHARTICLGIQPSWSADGQSFVCERRSKDSGIWVLDAGGLRGRRIAAGQGPKWSPDGKSIAFLQDNGVSIYELETGEIRQILIREDHPYQDLGRDLAWSPDSRRLAVLGNFAATSQLLILSTTNAKTAPIRIRYSFDLCCRGNLNWTDADGILMGVLDAKSRQTQLMTFLPDTDQPPKRFTRFAGLVPGQQNGFRSACLTPDGQWYITVVEE